MEKPKSDSLTNTEGWKAINWRQAQKYVFKLQKRIYAASRCGNVKRVRKLQKTLMRSWSNRILAVRRVTQDNQGCKTAGVDGVKSLSPAARLKLAGQLKFTGKSKPTRRVWIPKPGKDEKRPLGIPTMYDRALQAVVKTAIEPEWEAHFEKEAWRGKLLFLSQSLQSLHRANIAFVYGFYKIVGSNFLRSISSG